jgi:hypothetical protein
MADYLALDWDDQRLVGVAAHVASKKVEIRAVLDFTWGAGEVPSEQPEAAGLRLRAELDRTSASGNSVIVSLPREEAVVRLLELPECSDDELPELVRFQAVTRSAVPLERLLLDYLPLPALRDVVGRRVWMATIGKPVADRVQALLSAAGLEASAIRLSSIGAGELIAHQPDSKAAPSDAATLIVNCVDLRIEITAIWQNRIVLMHSATLSSHDPPEAQISQILAETARSTVALSQIAPSLQVGTGWLIGSRAEQTSLAETLAEQSGFPFHVLKDPASTPGVSADANGAIANSPLAWSPLGLLLGQATPCIDSVDFLHPRRQHPKPDRRKLYLALGAAAAVLVALGLWGAIQRRVWQLDDKIADMTESNKKIETLLKSNASLRETAASVDDWKQRDIEWLEQFRVIEQAKGGADKLYLTTFDANVAGRNTMAGNTLAVIAATGRAKARDEVDDFEDQLHDLGYRVTPKEISEDTDPQYPVKIDLSLDVVPKAAAAPTQGAGGDRKPESSTGRPGSSVPAGSSPTTAPPASAPPATQTPPATSPPATSRQAAAEAATSQREVVQSPASPAAESAPAESAQAAPGKN